nr:hypothetical protein [Trichoderma atroviride]
MLREADDYGTQSAQNSAGIQTLLDFDLCLAERNARIQEPEANDYNSDIQTTHIVRTKRVKEARDEAKKEIADYKASKEDEFKKFEAEHSKGNEAAEQEASKEAEKQIEVIKEAGKKNQDTVVKNLLQAVFDVKPVAA